MNGTRRIPSAAVVAGTLQDPTSLDLNALDERVIHRGLAVPPRRPTMLGVAPPTVGTPRPLKTGESGRYSLVNGRRIR